jgi:hypothetical protein
MFQGKMTEAEIDYYDLNMVSNSRLGLVKSMVDGAPLMKCKRSTLEFGKQLHEAVLEPEKYAYKLSINAPFYQEYKDKVKGMAASARGNLLLKFLLDNPRTKKEEDTFFIHERTGLQCKLKADIHLVKTIGDLKSTSCNSNEEFKASIVKYGYHRQGAFYMDATEANKFIVIGVSKKYPYHTFTHTFNYDELLIKEGRAEYEFLLDKLIEYEKQGVNFYELMKAA